MAVKETKQAQPKIVWKGSEEYRHDLFRLEESKCKRNQSYTRGNPMIEEIPHVHFFHSVDRGGKPCKYASMSNGHTHEVKVSFLDDGSIKATAGPALKEQKTKLRNGKVKTDMIAISWADDNTGHPVMDEHSHEVTYKHSEIITPNQLRAQQQHDAKKLGDLMGITAQVSKGTGAQLKEVSEE